MHSDNFHPNTWQFPSPLRIRFPWSYLFALWLLRLSRTNCVTRTGPSPGIYTIANNSAGGRLGPMYDRPLHPGPVLCRLSTGNHSRCVFVFANTQKAFPRSPPQLLLPLFPFPPPWCSLNLRRVVGLSCLGLSSQPSFVLSTLGSRESPPFTTKSLLWLRVKAAFVYGYIWRYLEDSLTHTVTSTIIVSSPLRSMTSTVIRLLFFHLF